MIRKLGLGLFAWGVVTAIAIGFTRIEAGGDPDPRTVLRVDRWPSVTVRHLPGSPGVYEARVLHFPERGDGEGMQAAEWMIAKRERLSRGEWMTFNLDAREAVLVSGPMLGLDFRKVSP